MSETTNKDDKLRAGGKKTLSLKRTVESGLVRQNFSHGRSKSVVVEKKKRRVIAQPGQPEGETAAAEAPAIVVETPAAPPPPAAVEPVEDKDAGRSGMVLRTLTDEEKDARAQALAEARAREASDRERAAEEAKRRKEQEERERQDRAAAEARLAEEEKRRKVEEDARRKAEEESARHRKVETDDGEEERARPVLNAREEAELARVKKARAEPKAPAKPTAREGERRRGRLTISNALNEDGERARSMAQIRRQRERARKQSHGSEPQQKIIREVTIPEVISIQELANRMAERAVDVIKLLMKQGQMVKITDVIDADMAQLIAEEMGHTVRRVAESDVEEGMFGVEDEDTELAPRSPVVTVMGHVDHGKTSLLDALRKTNVVSGEAGGITQHIGAYQVNTPNGKVTFIDTPGHAAFTAMRARGAKVTDIVILVVAADDGVMPQTVEAINHAKAAGVPIIVAINKIDKPAADPTRVRTDLLQHEIVVESMSGDVIEVEVSALKGTNLDKLLEMILLQAEVLDLKANPNRDADGVVIEAKLDKGRGPVATVLVQRGTLKVGDIVVAGAEWGKVRALIDDQGNNTDRAGPAVPVEILGLNSTPDAGDRFGVVENEARAREITDYRQRQKRDRTATRIAGARGSLEQMMTQLKSDERKNVAVVVKGDVQGSVEAIIGALDKLGTDEVAARIVHAGVGGITESDVSLAAASEAPIIGFNVRANKQAREAAEREGIEIRYYNIIYDLVDDMKGVMSGLLAPERRETFLGNAEILEVFNITKVGKVAGCRVTDGKVERGAGVRLIRDNVVIHEGKLSTLKRFKDEVKEVSGGQECGMAFENYQDIRQGDVIECFRVEQIKRSL